MSDVKISVPILVHEGILARMERTIKRLWILCIIIFIAFVGSNIYWIWYEAQFTEEEVLQTVVQDSGIGGSNRFSGKMVGGNDGEADYSTED